MSGTGDFTIDVINRSLSVPVLVDFWAPWCSACKVLSPTLNFLHERHKGEWILVKINVEKHPDLALRYSISAIPSVKLFVNGEVAGEFSGALPGHIIEEWLETVLPAKTQPAINKAKQLLFEGKSAEALPILSELLNKEPQNKEIKVLYARGIVVKNPFKAKELVSGIEPVGQTGELAESLMVIIRFLTEFDQRSKLPESPAKHYFLEAIDFLKSENFDQALQNLIDSLRVEKKYLDGFSKEVCMAIFRFLGEENPVTQKNRRILGTILYS